MKLSKQKQAIKDRALSILANLEHEEPVTKPDDVSFVETLLRMHPSAARKLGCGLKSFLCLVQYDGKKCFAVLRLDGTIEPFGLKQCLQPSTRRNIVHQALRATIHDQIMDFWANYKNATPESERLCPVMGTLITEDDHEVDHLASSLFHVIADEFIKLENIDVETLDLEKHPSRSMYDRPASNDVRQKFYAYHEARANLRVLSKAGNSQVEASRRKGTPEPVAAPKQAAIKKVSTRPNFGRRASKPSHVI